MRLEQWGAGKEHYRMASEYPEYVLGRVIQQERELYQVVTNQLETGVLRNDDKGRHTTTHRELFMIPGKGMVIDTPGMRELGMWSAQDGIDHIFSDMEEPDAKDAEPLILKSLI